MAAPAVAAAAANPSSLAVTEGEPSPCLLQGSPSRPLRSFLASLLPMFPFPQLSQLPGRTTHESGVLRLPYGDSSVLEMSVLGNIYGL